MPVPVLFHLADIYCAIAGGFQKVLWLVLLSSVAHFVLLGVIFYFSRRAAARETRAVHEREVPLFA